MENEIKVGSKVQFTMVELGGESDGTWVGTVERLFKNGKAAVRVSNWINPQGYKVFNVKVSDLTIFVK